MIVPGLGDAGDRQFNTTDDIPNLLPSVDMSPVPNKKAKSEK